MYFFYFGSFAPRQHETNLLCIKGPVQSVWVFEPAAAADDHMRSAEIREHEMKSRHCRFKMFGLNLK